MKSHVFCNENFFSDFEFTIIRSQKRKMSPKISQASKFPIINWIIKKSLHTNQLCNKYITNSELVHRCVMYGRSSYQKRPNDPRLPSNTKFGITYLNLKQQQQPQLISNPDFDMDNVEQKRGAISKAMKVYLERARQHGEFIQEQEHEFESGRRHLANMMGLQIDSLNQNDIDVSLIYAIWMI